MLIYHTTFQVETVSESRTMKWRETALPIPRAIDNFNISTDNYDEHGGVNKMTIIRLQDPETQR